MKRGALRIAAYAVAYASLGVSFAVGQEPLRDDRHRYEPQPLLSCSEADGRTGIFIGDACLLVSGEGRLAIGLDSSEGLVGWHSQLASATGVVATDLGPAFGVFTLRNEGGWPEDSFFGADGGLSIYEAYVAAGQDVRLTVGKAPTIIETNDDRALDWLGGYGAEVFFPLENNGTFPLTATSLQLTTSLSDELSLALALEDGPTTGNYWVQGVNRSRLVGVLAYDDGETSARLTVARFHDAGVWAGRLSMQSVIAESFRVLAVGSFGNGQSIDAKLTASAQLGTTEAAATVHKIGGYHDEAVSWSGSVTEQISPSVALRAGTMINEADAADDGFRQTALGVVINPWENAALDVSIGHVEDPFLPLWYGKVVLDWHVSDLAKAKLSAIATTEGGYKIESELVTSFR